MRRFEPVGRRARPGLRIFLFKALRRLIRPIGIQLVDANAIPPDIDEPDVETIQAVRSLTITSPERLYALI